MWVLQNCWGCLFYRTPWATASFPKNKGFTNKQHKITANMVDLTSLCSLSYVQQCLHVSGIFPSILKMQTGLEPPNGNFNLKTRNK